MIADTTGLDDDLVRELADLVGIIRDELRLWLAEQALDRPWTALASRRLDAALWLYEAHR